MKNEMTSMERLLAALSHKEPDRVPLLLMLSITGAREMQIPIKDYFSSPDLVVQTQLMMKQKYSNDTVNNMAYAALEVEAYGGEVIFTDDGPPNSGEPFIKKNSDIASLELPRIQETPCLRRGLEVTEKLHKAVGNTVPIIGLVISPFSVPVMQLGFERYLNLIYSDPKNFNLLMQKNMAFCTYWANAQLKAGATAIVYYDPLASPTIIEKETYLKLGHPIACKTLASIKGPVATHLASGITLPVIQEIIQSKSVALGFSNKDKVADLKEAARDKIALIGNLNGIEMMNWSPEDAHRQVKDIIAKAGHGGGFILSDCHGEIPFQVPESVLLSISEAVSKWGSYPLKLLGDAHEK